MAPIERRRLLATAGSVATAVSGCLRLAGVGGDSNSTTGDRTSTRTLEGKHRSAADDSDRRIVEAFSDGLNGWQIGLHPPSGEKVTEGDGKWTSDYGGSVHLHVKGGPDHVGVYKPFDGLEAGTVIVAIYDSPNLDGAPGGPRLRLHKSDEHKRQLDMDDGGEDPDGVLIGVVPKEMPAGTTVEFRLGVWPGEIDVYLREIQIIAP